MRRTYWWVGKPGSTDVRSVMEALVIRGGIDGGVVASEKEKRGWTRFLVMILATTS